MKRWLRWLPVSLLAELAGRRKNEHPRTSACAGHVVQIMERDLIREHTLDGLRAAQAQGRHGGRPAAVIDDILAIARARRQRGESVTAIARHLGVGRSTLTGH
jgi:hypothetical protein